MLVKFLVVFFLFLILYQIFLAYLNSNATCIEGLDNYKEYDLNNPNNALILAQQNAGNISYLKQRVDELANVNKEVYDISLNVAQLNSQIQGLVQQQANAATSLVGSTPPEISGTTEPVV